MRRALVLALVVLSVETAAAGPPRAIPPARQWADMTQGLLAVAREHRKGLEESIPRRERDLQAASASLDRNTQLYARGVITRAELDAAAREAGEARAQLDWTRQELVRTTALIVELEAKQRLATLPPLRPGQYETSGGLVRYAGTRELSPGDLTLLERNFIARIGRSLPVSAMGQSDVHTRLGLDHRHAVDVALHPDSEEGRYVMAWLRERSISFLGFRTARAGAATGAHIHIGRPSERWGVRAASPTPPTLRAGHESRPSASAAPSASAPPFELRPTLVPHR